MPSTTDHDAVPVPPTTAGQPGVPLPGTLAATSVALAVLWAVLQATQAALALAPASGGWTIGDTAALVLLPVQVAAYVVSCLWLARCRSIAVVLSPRRHQQRSAGWVWGGWLVPVVCLWFPYQVVRDVRDATAGPARTVGLHRWWAAWVAALLVDNQAALAGLGLGAFSPGTVPALQVVAAVLVTLALVGWVRIVREVTVGQRRRLG